MRRGAVVAARARARAARVRRHPRRVARRHRQAGRRRARARQRLHRLPRGCPPAQADHAGRGDPAGPLPAANRAHRRRPARGRAAAHLRSRRRLVRLRREPRWGMAGDRRRRRHRADRRRSRRRRAGRPPRRATQRPGPRGRAPADGRDRPAPRQPRLLRHRHHRALAGHHRDVHVGQLRPPARLPRRRRGQPDRAPKPRGIRPSAPATGSRAFSSQSAGSGRASG